MPGNLGELSVPILSDASYSSLPKILLCSCNNCVCLTIEIRGGSPGLVVMGRDSQSEGRGFKSWHHKLDGHFYTYIFCKNCNDVCLKRPKINEKEAGVGPFFSIKKTIEIRFIFNSKVHI